MAADAEDISVFALIDVTAAFNTFDHDIFLQSLQTSFGEEDAVLGWFQSLTGRVHYVHRGSAHPVSGVAVWSTPKSSSLSHLHSVHH